MIHFAPIANIHDYQNNARRHPPEQLAKIRHWMETKGWTMPALVEPHGDAYNMLAGHGRKAIAAAVYADGKTLRMADGTPIPPGCIPVVYANGWTDDEKAAYVLADNELPNLAEWDEAALIRELESLRENDFDLNLLGFDEDEINRLLDTDVQSVEFPELPDGDRDPFTQKTFTLHDEQADVVDDALTKAKTLPQIDTGLNENSNGNALAYICEQWLNRA